MSPGEVAMLLLLLLMALVVLNNGGDVLQARLESVPHQKGLWPYCHEPALTTLLASVQNIMKSTKVDETDYLHNLDETFAYTWDT